MKLLTVALLFLNLKINHVIINVSLPGIQVLIGIKSGCEYFTLCESFNAKNSAGTSYVFAGKLI